MYQIENETGSVSYLEIIRITYFQLSSFVN